MQTNCNNSIVVVVDNCSDPTGPKHRMFNYLKTLELQEFTKFYIELYKFIELILFTNSFIGNGDSCAHNCFVCLDYTLAHHVELP